MSTTEQAPRFEPYVTARGTRVAAAVLILIISAAGCQSVQYSRSKEARYFKPTVGVVSFENRAPMVARWNVGDDMADQLIDRLLTTRRYIVLDRGKSANMSRTMSASSADRYRQSKTTYALSPSDMRYLVRGSITDFGAIKTVQGIWPLTNMGVMKERTHRTVAMTLYVVDTQTGQVIASRNIESKFKETDDKQFDYKTVSFGSFAFYHTPLGEATADVLDEAVRTIAKAIEEQEYQPKIASVVGNQVIINGGKDRRIKIANEYVVRPSPDAVVDPDSGRVLGHVSGEIIGRVQVTQVSDRYAIARVVEGDGFAPGQALFPAQKKQPYQPLAQTPY